MAAADKPLDEEEMVSFIVIGLDFEFNPVISTVLARVEPITVNELFTQLLAFEQRMDLYHGTSGSSANTASRGRGSGVHGRNCSGHMSCGRGNCGRGRANNNNRPKIRCQLYKKDGHGVLAQD